MATQDGLWELDLVTYVPWFDERFEAILGYEKDQLKTLRSFAALLHSADLKHFESDLHTRLQNLAVSRYDGEFRVRHRAGHHEWLRSRGLIERGADGRPLRLTASIQLITDQKSAEQATLGDKLAAQAANRAKSCFLANMSHEIRTPMNGVIGIARILSETTLDDTQREYVDIICGSAQALLSLINDVLDLSKIEADRLELESVDFNLRNVVYETATALALQAAERGIEVIATVAPDAPRGVRGDPGRLRQIIINLLGNAIKFTPEGHVLLHVTQIGQAGAQAHVRIEVTDTGIGIDAEGLGKLFRPFAQIDASTTRHFGGSGLGLSIVKRLVELMGGEVGVTSEVDRGSTFWFTIKLDTVATDPKFEPIGENRRILIVDDVAASRSSLATKLEAQCYTTQCASSAEEAVEILRAGGRFDLVLCDELMPRRGGYSLLAELRAQPLHARLPFIVMSLIGTEHHDADRALIPDAIVTKPVRGLILGETIQKVLTGKPDSVRMQGLVPAAGVSLVGARILLAEDHPVNQRVASRLLEKIGAAVVIANDGAEAIARVAESRFDALLMDCQMPVMDGWAATERIREIERQSGSGTRLPIIALTANVMNEDRERCIAAGMDDHLGKPIDARLLTECLARHVNSAAMAAEFDADAWRAMIGDDREFERELIATFVLSGDQRMAEIVDALRSNDLDTVKECAHALKGASASIHAHGLTAAASRLEKAARDAPAQEIEVLVQRLAAKLDAVNEQLRNAG